jgi:PAS domain S-box-containing protein
MTTPARILVVDDNAITRKMLRVLLESEGHQVVEAADGAAALEAASQQTPDLVLLDIVLPDIDGVILVGRLRALPGAQGWPILALSAMFENELDPRAATAGFSEFLTKPIEPARLAETLRTYLPETGKHPDVAPAGRSVLVVDDDPVQRKLTRVQLEQRGYRVTAVASASAALRAARRVSPDAIVSDVLMPGVDGFQLCLEVRSDPDLAGVPVVLVSNHYDADEDVKLAREAGASSLVGRTPEHDQIAKALADALEHDVAPLPEAEIEKVAALHRDALRRQLDRQLAAKAELSRRCALQAAELEVVARLSEAVANRDDPHEAQRDVVAGTLDAVGLSRGALYLDNGGLKLRHAIGFGDADTDGPATFFGHLALLDELIERNEDITLPSSVVDDESTREILSATDSASAAIIVLSWEGRGVGALVLFASRAEVFAEGTFAFARAVAGQIANSIALEAAFEKVSGSERNYRTLMDRAHDTITVLTLDGEIIQANQRWNDVLGIPPDEMIGRHVREFAAPGNERANSAAFFQAVSKEVETGPPLELRHANGATVVMQFSNSVQQLDGRSVVLAVGRDVTEHVRSQAQLMVSDRMVSVGMLAAGVAHEINNPLFAVTANLEVASRDLDALIARVGGSVDVDELREELSEARMAAQRVREIVRDLKIFSRSEDEQRAAVDIHAVLESTLRMAWNEVKHRARLVRDYGEVLPVFANEARLGQVFLNLVVNAAQAIPTGEADQNEIRVVTRMSDDRDRLVIDVVDTGPGIPPEILAKLFTPFFTTKPIGEGTGLGLMICQRIVNEVGGSIEVDSEVGVGTTVRVSLPVATEASTERSEEPPAVVVSARRVRILVVDDDAVVGRAVKRGLSGAHDVELFTAAREALARIEAGERYDVILCDLMMPVMDGAQLYHEIQRVAPELVERIIFMTGGAFTAAAREFLDTVANPRIDKPFDLDTLRALVNTRFA